MPVKTVQVKVKQHGGYRTECTAGNHQLIIDQPTTAGGSDGGPSPLEYQLMALGGCIAAIGRLITNQRRLPVRGFDMDIRGTIDTDPLLGKPSSNRVGFSTIEVHVRVDADLSPEEKKRLIEEVEGRCPISENLQNATPVKIVVDG